VLSSAELPLPSEVVNLGDVRLLDILAWAAAGERDEELEDD
jgi:hypothetical protein